LRFGARNPSSGQFIMLGKTFKGLTDAMLPWQTQRLLELESRRNSWTVHVRPELVVEVAFDTLQRSSRYPGGVTLRFARVIRYRPDKRPEEADTIEAVRALGFERSLDAGGVPRGVDEQGRSEQGDCAEWRDDGEQQGPLIRGQADWLGARLRVIHPHGYRPA
jgi:hypothetical protein